jgi:hypothetical protein
MTSLKTWVVGAGIATMSSMGLIAAPVTYALPMIPLEPPTCDVNGQPVGCIPPATLLLPYYEVDLGAPKKGPGVSFDPTLGGLVAHINDQSGVAAQCEYKSDFYTRSFFLPANGTYDMRIVPAVPQFREWPVNITCDNGTSTSTSQFF